MYTSPAPGEFPFVSIKLKLRKRLQASSGSRARSCGRQVVSSIPNRGNEYFRSGVTTRQNTTELNSAIQKAMLPEFDGKRGTGCFNTRFPGFLFLSCYSKISIKLNLHQLQWSVNPVAMITYESPTFNIRNKNLNINYFTAHCYTKIVKHE